MPARLIIPVTYDARVGYIAERAGAPAISALSLVHLRRRLEQSEGTPVRLVLDLRARRERDRRQRGGHGGPQQWR
jgi:hypothetical protein